MNTTATSINQPDMKMTTVSIQHAISHARISLFVFFLPFVLTSCDSASPGEVVSIAISGGSEKGVPRGADLTLIVNEMLSSGESRAATGAEFQSADPSIASVNSSGVVTGVARGSATITVTLGEYNDSVVINVIDVAGIWDATVPDPAAPGGTNHLVYRYFQDGSDVTGTYSNQSGFPPITSDSVANSVGNLVVTGTGETVTLEQVLTMPSSPCQLTWTNNVALGRNLSGELILTPRLDPVDLRSPNCPEVRAQIRVAEVTYVGPID